jgi:hypothetical protein
MLAHSEDSGKLLWRGTVATSTVFDSRNGGQFYNCYPTIRKQIIDGKPELVHNIAECPKPVEEMSGIGIVGNLFANDGWARHMRKMKNGMIQLY